MASESHRKIGVFSHGGTKNLGDEALLAAVIQNVRLRIPGAEIVGFTINPDDTRQRHGITSFPIRQWDESPSSSAVSNASHASTASSAILTPEAGWKRAIRSIPGLVPLFHFLRTIFRLMKSTVLEPKFLLDSCRRLRGVELLLVAGSQQLNDGYGGPWGFPFTLYKWSRIARLTGTKVAILSVGAGPIDSPLSRFFFSRVLRMCSYRSYRDAISSRLVESMGVKGPNPVYPDLVYSLKLPAPRPLPTESHALIVGANPVPFFDGRYWPEPDPARYADYVRKFADFAEWLDGNGYSVLFFPTQARADVLTIDDIRAALNGSGKSPRMLAGIPIQNIEDLISEIARTDLVIANRYHGILLSLALNKPVLGVAYHEKSRALLEQVGQGDYVLNIADLRTEDLIEKFKALHANSVAIKKQIAASMAPLREALEQQYDLVFGLIGVAPSCPQKVNRPGP
jgi:polysaccharide pyruvyl transferase WcaK-like protein